MVGKIQWPARMGSVLAGYCISTILQQYSKSQSMIKMWSLSKGRAQEPSSANTRIGQRQGLDELEKNQQGLCIAINQSTWPSCIMAMIEVWDIKGGKEPLKLKGVRQCQKGTEKVRVGTAIHYYCFMHTELKWTAWTCLPLSSHTSCLPNLSFICWQLELSCKKLICGTEPYFG